MSITVDIGNPHQTVDDGNCTVDRAISVGVDDGSSTDGEVFVESAPEEYVDRKGYQATFLGDDLAIPQPTITTDADDVLTFALAGHHEQVLKYEHYSALMSATRRLCRFSAVNIDGNRPKKFARVGWRTDPRIPMDAQIKAECYGNPPKFARGHMTRREDPVWGSDTAASRGNADSMHVTNAVPQMQPFNAGIWLDLEDYALQNARRDDMKISVFTGPFLHDDDPTMFGVQVPVEFWKIIAFVHDETGELCATGYTMSQRDFLSEEEFVYGAHETAQRSISSIERRAGLSFGALAELDPFEEQEGIAPHLTDVTQIQFIRHR
ncbi:DNA/RNA non-specific endonuclease [Rhodococcus sp. MTM3W5.2]|uniref:DNA/RNA non-specific endonuclease n=1 Tax=Rhodococcus sp. MTM3W5.2 TaxID=1805827 RepID=UPI001CB8CB8E|nr:DNA/RNA non-specific endonuclease [Rhodococcus sp. MTM3W5.2]